MTNNDYKKRTFLDRFVKHWCCSAGNHPEGWSWWKRKARRDGRRANKNELRRELEGDDVLLNDIDNDDVLPCS